MSRGTQKTMNANYDRYNRAGESSWTRLYDCTDCTQLCNTVYYAVLLMVNDQIRSKHVEQTKKSVE